MRSTQLNIDKDVFFGMFMDMGFVSQLEIKLPEECTDNDLLVCFDDSQSCR